MSKEPFEIAAFETRELPTEAEIMATWKKQREPLVSICCITYNHANYVKEALNSFLIQKTDFKFEIVVHDDASTDDTVEILKQYTANYPNIIRLLLQNENQYNKGNFRPIPYTAKRAKGHYIAICEGDDKWLCTHKLAKQVSVLKQHADVDLCFHPTLYFSSDDGEMFGVANKYGIEEKLYTANDFVKAGGGFCPTASLMISKKVFEELPDWFYDVVAGDYYFQCFAALSGGGIFIPDVMAAYRWESSSSVTQKTKNADALKLQNIVEKELLHLNEFNNYTSTKFNDEVVFRQAVVCQEFSALLLKMGDYTEFRSLISKSWGLRPNLNFRQKLLYKLRFIPILLRSFQYFKKMVSPIPTQLEVASEEDRQRFQKRYQL